MDKENTNLFLIENRATLKAFFHPLRARIMEVVTAQPLTVKSIAARLGVDPGKLYYHVNLLEKHGLLRVVETRQVANMIEKTYQAVSDQLDIAPALLATTTADGKDALYGMITSTLDATRLDMLRSLQTRYRQLENGAPQQERVVVINRDVQFITDARAAEFAQRLKALLEEFAASEVPPSTPEAMHYGIAFAFYPSFFDKDSEQNE